ncbi:MAG: DNA primase [Candidatus Nomurabacteria bacterium]|jgi:DNA primase|nr:DNA primase [Candidatus Nomurabacteria bacterium]
MNDAKEEIKARLAIEDVIGQYIELKRAGRNLKGHSPWGTDRTPSFMVSPEKNIWHDFSSGRGGDIFSFIMEVEGISFREALEKLATKAGVELTKYSGGDQKVAAHKKRLSAALELAAKYYQVCLTKNKPVMEYVFYKRNLNKKTVENFRIGYAPMSGHVLVDFLKKREFNTKELEDAGLVNRFGGDFFKGRMMVPLMDGTGNVIGFTARILNDQDKNSPKYLNTPETILYNKSRHIFGLSQAKESIRKHKFAVVVEGNMDVISSHQASVTAAVATAGTAMTEQHLKILSRLTDDIRLAYDGDEAGVNAAERAVRLANDLGIYLSVIDDYHGCKDADELIQKDPKLWQKAVEHHRPAVEWLLNKYEERYNLRTERGFQEYSDTAKALIANISDSALRERYEQMVVKKLGISLESFRAKELKVTKHQLKKIEIPPDVRTKKPTLATKSLAALIQFAKIPPDPDLELPKDLDPDEIKLIYEEKYADWDQAKLTIEAADLTQKLKHDQRDLQKKSLQAALSQAEENNDETKIEELINKLNDLNKQA